MRHFGANYIFDGTSFIKNSCLSFDDNNKLISIGAENSAVKEKERMYFFNGVLCPYFDAKSLVTNNMLLRDVLCSLGLHFDKYTRLPIVLLEGIDLQMMSFTDDTIIKEVY